MSKFISALRTMSEAAVKDYIRGELTRGTERLRFDMSGYDYYESPRYDGDEHRRIVGSCVLHNQRVLNTFAHLGIYDYSQYLFVDFYKGCGFIYINGEEHEVGGCTTADIIYEVFKLTILSGKGQRRRG